MACGHLPSRKILWKNSARHDSVGQRQCSDLCGSIMWARGKRDNPAEEIGMLGMWLETQFGAAIPQHNSHSSYRPYLRIFHRERRKHRSRLFLLFSIFYFVFLYTTETFSSLIYLKICISNIWDNNFSLYHSYSEICQICLEMGTILQ